MTPKKTTYDRFSGRVENYAKYRPSYPRELLVFLVNELRLQPGSHVADIGSGTGIFTKLLLDLGMEVFAVEPGEEMRIKAESLLGNFPRFHSINGTGEATTLAGHSMDMVTCAQAFHWCDPVAMRLECQRILKPGGYAVLVWNNRDNKGTDFAVSLEQFITIYATDYEKINHNIPEGYTHITTFFGAGHFQCATFRHHQRLDMESFKGRLLSASYMPDKAHPAYEAMCAALERLFHQYAEHGHVTVDYTCEAYYGEMGNL